MTAADYQTLGGVATAEIEISRSRFLTQIERVESEDQARALIARVRAEHPRARHHCSAFVLGPGQLVRRSNDDGEPGGTAGAPMLDALVSAGLSDVAAVVTRYFGGVLLGAGGLTRAYRAAVAEAVAQAPRVTRALRVPVSVQCGYDTAPLIEAEARRRGFSVLAAEYTDEVRVRLAVEPVLVPVAAEMVAELSAGAANINAQDPVWVDLA